MSRAVTTTAKYAAGRKTVGCGTGTGWAVFTAAAQYAADGRDCANQQRNHEEET